MQIFCLYTVLGHWHPYYYVNKGQSNSINSPDISWQNSLKKVKCIQKKSFFGTQEAGRWPQHQKDHHGFEAVEINGRIHTEDKLRAEKEERVEKINWQEGWKENEEDCDTAFDIWRKSYNKKSEEEMWIVCKRPNSTKNVA